MRRWAGGAVVLLGVLTPSVLAGTAAHAAVEPAAAAPAPLPSDKAELKRRLDALFDEILKDPSALEPSLEYARVATALGDYEAAVSALERLLFFNPTLARIRLELGVLYYRLGSYGLARTYLEQARGTADLPPDVAQLVDRYLAEIDRLDSRHRFTGQLNLGILHETNANIGPDSGAVRFFGFPFTIGPQFRKTADQALYGSGSILYSYDLQDQDRTTIETTGQAYVSHHFRVRDFDTVYLEGTIGPRTTLATWGLVGFTARPYLIADYVHLGGDPFFHALGFGLDAAQAITPDLVLRGVYEFRDKRYNTAPGRPTGGDFSGNDNGVTLELSYSISPYQLVAGSASFLDQSVRQPWFTNRQYGGGLAYRLTYEPPIVTDAGAWQTTFSAGFTFYDYAEPDPIVDPFNRRFDRRWRLAAAQVVPLVDGLGLSLQVQHEIVNSSIPNFQYTNTSVVFGPQFRF